MDKLKVCASCKVEKEWKEFNLRKTGTPYSYCQSCYKPQQRDYSKGYYLKRKQEGRKDENKPRRLLRQYGITIDQYNAMKAACADCCVLCGTSPVFVDHCHKTGVVRGMLCRNCNFGLGLFQDNSELLRKAASYLEEVKHVV